MSRLRSHDTRGQRRAVESTWTRASRRYRQRRNDDEGFTLLELIIVTAVLPIIIGALAMGLVSVFSLQSGVASRLSGSEDEQVVTSTYLSDVQSSGYITTQATSNPECISSAQIAAGDVQLLGLGSNFSSVTDTYETSVSYISEDDAGVYALIRDNCSDGTTTPASSQTLTANLQSAQPAPTVICSTATCDVSSAWILSQNVSKVEFVIKQTGSQDTGTVSYTLAAVPQSAATIVTAGGAISTATKAGCGYASAGSGTYAATLCLVDFAALTGSNLLAAENGCLEMVVTLPSGDYLYYCIGITGAPVQPASLPTYADAFLGNSCNSTSCTSGTPFYTDIPGDPALYQCASNCAAGGGGTGQTVITISGITVVGPNNVPATGWEVVSADAESTDDGESISWTSSTDLYVLNNNDVYDTATDPVGNACVNGDGLITTNNVAPATGNTISCYGTYNNVNTTSSLKTGTPMVWGLEPKSLQITMFGTGLEGMAFGLILS